MATIEYWIQIENRLWDVCWHNKDRMTGQTLKQREGIDPVDVTITSPETPVKTRKVKMYKPLKDSDGKLMDALILRRYRPPSDSHPDPWTIPDDRKVNPWDLNEQDPTDKGTMGTIPGPVIECNVGDKVIVHFRNLDMRTHPVTKTTTHIVHTTCTKVTWEPGDRTNGFKPHKVVEEVPCDKTQTVTHTEEDPLPVKMRTHSLHPHGFAFLAVHDGAYPLSPEDKSQPVGSEQPLWNLLNVKKFKKGDRVPPAATFDYTWIAGAPSEDDPNTIEPWPTTAGVWLYHDHSICDMENVTLGAIGIIVIHNPADAEQEVDIRKPKNPDELDPDFLPGGLATGPVTTTRNRKKSYFPPPDKALYLQLFHTLTGTNGGMLINGRQYMGNTPTLISGPETLMRFGVIGMGAAEFHTFHIHGHRWAIPGPDGSDQDTIQNSPQIRAVSQFEDTRIFGPANSFVFSIKEGEFFGARDDEPEGEYHMHCHVLSHMDMGMMGSLLIIPKKGGVASVLPEGVPCPSDMGGGMPPMNGGGGKTVKVDIANVQFPPDPHIHAGDTVVWTNKDGFPHTVTDDNNAFDSSTIASNGTYSHKFTTAGVFHYHCNIHPSMHGTVTVT